MADNEQEPAGHVSAAETRGYLFEMLSELSAMAHGCGEARVAVVLSTIVAVLHGRVEPGTAQQSPSLQ